MPYFYIFFTLFEKAIFSFNMANVYENKTSGDVLKCLEKKFKS